MFFVLVATAGIYLGKDLRTKHSQQVPPLLLRNHHSTNTTFLAITLNPNKNNASTPIQKPNSKSPQIPPIISTLDHLCLLLPRYEHIDGYVDIWDGLFFEEVQSTAEGCFSYGQIVVER